MRRKLIASGSPPKDKRQTEEQIAVFAKKATQHLVSSQSIAHCKPFHEFGLYVEIATSTRPHPSNQVAWAQ
jgi:hypothetical protein